MPWTPGAEGESEAPAPETEQDDAASHARLAESETPPAEEKFVSICETGEVFERGEVIFAAGMTWRNVGVQVVPIGAIPTYASREEADAAAHGRSPPDGAKAGDLPIRMPPKARTGDVTAYRQLGMQIEGEVESSAADDERRATQTGEGARGNTKNPHGRTTGVLPKMPEFVRPPESVPSGRPFDLIPKARPTIASPRKAKSGHYGSHKDDAKDRPLVMPMMSVRSIQHRPADHNVIVDSNIHLGLPHLFPMT
jgi:hypothetical protein